MNIPFHFFTVVWGKLFIENFAEIVLPCMLASRNLGYCAKRGGDKYFIYTTDEDKEYLVASPAFKKLQEIISTEVITFEIGDSPATREDSGKTYYWKAWLAVTTMYRERALLTAKGGAALVYLGGDELWANGAFEAMHQLIDSGKKAILINGGAIKPKLAIPLLKEKYLNLEKNCITISPRELVKVMLDHTHEYHLAMLWNHPLRQNGGGTYLHSVPEEGLILRNCGASPTVIVHSEGDPLWPIEHGLELVEHVSQLHDWNNIHIVQDSDEIMMAALEVAEFGSREYKLRTDQIFQPASILREAFTMQKSLSSARIRVAEHPLRWHFKDLTALWYEEEKKFAEVFNKILVCKKFLEDTPDAFTDLQSHFSAIDSLREKRKESLKLVSDFENILKLLADSSIKTETLIGLSWLNACEGDDEKSMKYLAQILKFEFEKGCELFYQLIAIFKITQRTQACDTAINVMQEYLIQAIPENIETGLKKTQAVIEALREREWHEIANGIMAYLLPALRAIESYVTTGKISEAK